MPAVQKDNLPKTYKAIVIEAKSAPFKIVDKDLELPKDNEVLIKVEACGVCHSDVIAKDGYWPIPYPITPGHEVVGRVVAIGARVNQDFFKLNDRVGAGWEGGHCHQCKPCRKGAFVACEKGTVTGIFKHGGYAEYCIIREESVVRVPEDMDAAEAAPLLCAGVTVYNAMRNMNAQSGDLVAIQGVGGLGHVAIQFARAMGFKVAAISTSPDKEELAKKLGAHVYIGSKNPDDIVKKLNEHGGAKIIVCTAPHGDAISPLVKGMAVDGTLCVVAAAGPVTVDTNVMIGKRLALRAWASGTALDSEETIQFAKLTDVRCHIEKFNWKDADKAYEKMMANKVRFRAVLTMD